MRGFLDRDIIKTIEGMIFCVVGGIHPKDRIISYLKYVPSQVGKWMDKSEKYARTMPTYTIPSLLKNIESLSKSYPQYVFNSRIFHIRMSAIPRQLIKEHYCPENKFERILKLEKRDMLQDLAINVVTYLSKKANIPKGSFGITGSILLDIHQIEFSDVDLVVYGFKNSLKVKEVLQEEFKRGKLLQKIRSESEAEKILLRWSKNYPLTYEEAKEFHKRRWNFGYFKNTAFSIHPVKTRDEINEKYGTKTFNPEGIISGRAKIVDSSQSLFLPAVYIIQKFESEGRNIHVREVVTYDGFYMGLFNDGDDVKIRGKLEKVHNKETKENYYRILIGSLEAEGKDYIKPSCI